MREMVSAQIELLVTVRGPTGAAVRGRGDDVSALEVTSNGRLVYVSGRLHSRSWTAADGTGRYQLEIIADNIQFLTSKPGAAPAAA